MKDADFHQLFNYELSMTEAWRQSALGEASCIQLFRLQSENGFEDMIHNLLLGGYINQCIVSAGFCGGHLRACFHVELFRRKYERHALKLTSGQKSLIDGMMKAWTGMGTNQSTIVYSYERDDLDWLPQIESVLRLGIYGLYELYRTEQREYCRYLEYIELLNNAIDRYKYLACKAIVENQREENAHEIYRSLGRVKYLTPRTMMDALHIMLFHYQTFRCGEMKSLDRLLLPYFEYDARIGDKSLAYQRSMLYEFIAKCRFSAYSLDTELRIGIEGTNHAAFNQLIAESLEI